MLQITKKNKSFGIIVSIVGMLFAFGSAHATTFEATISRVYLNTSGGVGPTLDDDFGEDYYDISPWGESIIRILDALNPPPPQGVDPYYWFHRGSVGDTSLFGSGLRVTLDENEEVCLVYGVAGGSGWMNDTGESDFSVYFTNPANVWEIGPHRWNFNYIHITRLPYEESTKDCLGVYFNYTSGWYEGSYYELLVRTGFQWYKDGVEYKGDPIIFPLDDASDVLGIRLVVTPTGHAEGFYNLNEGSWQLLGTVESDWWVENYLSVAYNVGLIHETGEAMTIEATVDMDPGVLSVKSKGNWITCYIELSEDYDVSDINIGTILLNGVVPAENKPTEIGDYDNDGILDLMVKFDRSAVQNIVEVGDEVVITVTGDLTDGIEFEGADTIKVIDRDIEN